jgi:hypothetical protein
MSDSLDYFPISSFLILVNGTQEFNITQDDGDSFAFLSFQSTDLQNGRPTLKLEASSAVGLVVTHALSTLRLNPAEATLHHNGVSFGIQSSGYVVSDPAAFRAAMGFVAGIEDHEAVLYARTTNPGIIGRLWNDNGTLRFSDGTPFTPSLNFQDSRNSQYIALLFEDF